MNRKGDLSWNLKTVGMLIFYAIILILIVGMVYSLISLFVAGEENHRAKQNFKYFIERLELTQEQQLQYPENSVILALPENYLIIGFDAGQERLESQNLSAWESIWQKLKQERVTEVSIPRPEKQFFGLLGEECDPARACVCIADTNPTAYYFLPQGAVVPNTPSIGDMEFTINPARVGEAELHLNLIDCQSLDVQTVGGTQDRVELEVTAQNIIFQPEEHSSIRVPGGPAYELILSTQDGPQNVYFEFRGQALLISAGREDPAEGGRMGGGGTTGGWS